MGTWESKNDLEGKEQGNREPNLTNKISTNQYPKPKCRYVFCNRGVNTKVLDHKFSFWIRGRGLF